MSVSEIESAITQLPAKEFVELMAWIEQYHERAWDKQIETDLESGRLDALLKEVAEEHEAGLARPPSTTRCCRDRCPKSPHLPPALPC